MINNSRSIFICYRFKPKPVELIDLVTHGIVLDSSLCQFGVAYFPHFYVLQFYSGVFTCSLKCAQWIVLMIQKEKLLWCLHLLIRALF